MWCGAPNITQISKWNENQSTCSALCGFYLMSLDGKGCWVRLGEAGGNPVPRPPNVHSFLAFYTPKLSPSPAEMNRGELDEQGAFPPHQRAFTRQTNSSLVWCRGWDLPACMQRAEVALKSARRTENSARSQCQQGSRAGTEDASQDRLFWTAPSSGMGLINKRHFSGAGWDGSLAWASPS